MESKAYAQSYYIIQNLSEELKCKIPKRIILGIKSKINLEDDLEIKKYAEIKDIELLEDAEKILSVLYTDYIATEEERNIIKNKEKMCYIKQESEKLKKYSIDIFKNNKNEVNNEIKKESIELIEYKENILYKFLNKIKKIFYKK